MILDDNGKFSSLRTTEENKKLLLDEMARLSPAERAVFKHMLQEKLQAAPGTASSVPAAAGQTSIYDALGAAEFKYKPVDLETFVYDPYFLGETCSSLYPALFQDLQNIFTQGYNEVILTGSIGYGKSFVSSIGLARILYELSCLKNPQKSYGLAPNSMISILILSVNETLALKVAFEYIISKLEMSKYFEKEFPYKKLKKEIKFPSNILVIARATTDTSALGMNPIAAMLDELNFLRKLNKSSKTMAGQKYDQAEAIYNVIKRRMKSRFEKKGRLPGVMFLASSKNTFDDFTARRVREAKSDPKIYVVDRTVWEVRPEDFDMTKGFKVLAGNEVVPSKVLEEIEVEAAEASCPEGAAVVWVPDEFRADFDRDLEGALRDIAGRATAAISPFITRREKIAHAESLIPGRVHPYSTEALEMGKPGTFLWNLMVKALPDRETGRQELKPIFSPDQIRHAHIDTSLRGDHTGLVVSHICGYKDVVRRNEEGLEYMERAPIFYVDLSLEIVPPPGGEIVLGDVRRLLYEMTQHGYLITKVTTDTYQSADTIQQLMRKGYDAEILSVDTSTDPYDNLKLALYEDRVILYPYPTLQRELRSLERNYLTNKIDHPPRGSKDVSDSLAGSLYSLQQAFLDAPLPFFGSSTKNIASLLEYHQQSMAGAIRENPVAMQPIPLGGTLPFPDGILPPFLTSGDQDWDFYEP